MAAGYSHTCAVKANGELVCWGFNSDGQCNVPPHVGQVAAVAAGHLHTCAVKANGDLICWGGDYLNFGVCRVPPDLGPVVAVAAGYSHTCAVKANGELVCWGFNSDGQCNVPPGFGPVAAVAAGHLHTCALKANGDLFCSHFGQCDVPPELGPVVAVAAGYSHTCAVKANGELVCWGQNDFGVCDVPPALGPVAAVAAGLLPASKAKDRASPSFAEPVVQNVDHLGPAALIPADEAAAIVAQQEASFIEHNINSVAWSVAAASQPVYRVVLLHFSRAPADMRDALKHSEGLRAVFHELEQAGLNWLLPSGTKILVPPHVYHMLLSHLNCNPELEQQLHSSHILVSEELQSVVIAAVGLLPSKLRVRLADYDTLTLTDAASSADSEWSMAASASMEPWGWAEGDLVVRRSFLELRPADDADDVTQSTGQGGNPRLAVRRSESF